MEIVLISENSYYGKIPTGFPHMRLDAAWANCLDAKCVNLDRCQNEPADIAIFILPKKTRKHDNTPLLYKKQHPKCKVGVMQEGPVDYFYEFAPRDQFQFLDNLSRLDFLLAHNQDDRTYLHNLIRVSYVGVFKSIYDHTQIPEPCKNRSGVILSGNMSKWYGGTYPLFHLLKYYPDIEITIPENHPGSGRISQDEKLFWQEKGVNFLPCMSWKQWINKLNKFKLGINLMPTRAAGTFSMNCASLGIPCIGYDDLDTQDLHNSVLSIDKSSHMTFKTLVNIMLTNQEVYEKYKPKISYAKKTRSIEDNKEHYREIMKEILCLN